MPKSFRLLAAGIFLTISLFATVPLAHGQTLEVLHSLQGSEGAGPEGALVQGNDGDFYGTASYGGINANGTVFKIVTNGTMTTLVTFKRNSGDPLV